MISSQLNSRAGIYLRLSQEDERIGESGSITNQRALLTKYVQENGFKLIDEYVDDGYSGTNFNRPSFQRLLKDIASNKIDVVITKDLSRLGREHIDTCFYVEKFFPENNIRYISILDGIDTAIDNGINDITPFKAILNDMYAKDISKKIKSVKRNRAEAGLYMATYRPYGYNKDINNKNHLVVNEEEAEIVKRIFKYAATGMSPLQISYILNEEKIPTPSESIGNRHCRTDEKTKKLWNAGVIRRMLLNELYIGNMVMGKSRKLNYKSKKTILLSKEEMIVTPNTHKAIVSEEIFNQVQLHIERRRTTRVKTYNPLLKGLIVCKECGKKLGNYVANGKTLYFRCRTYTTYPKARICTPHNNNVEKLTKIVIQSIRERCQKYIDEQSLQKLCQNKKIEIKKEKNNEKLLAQINKQINDVEKRIDQIYNDKVYGVIQENDFQRLYQRFDSERAELIIKKESLLMKKEEKEQTVDLNKIVKQFLKMEDVTETILSMLIEKIEVSQYKEIYIHYKFNELNE